MDYRLYIYDAHSGKLRVSEGLFLTIGAAETNTFQVNMKAKTAGTFACKGAVCRFFPHGTLDAYSINGTHLKRDVAIPNEQITLMTMAGGCILCWFGQEGNVPDLSELDSEYWYTYDLAAKAWSRPMRLEELCEQEDSTPPDTIVIFEGLTNCAFLAKDLMEASLFAKTLAFDRHGAVQGGGEAEQASTKTITCPHCWERFTTDQILAIAGHPSLKGDPVLGPKYMLRFTPHHYDGQGIPLDKAGTPCRGTACPHCHRKLPPFLAGMRQHIISLIGAPYSGKTYLLATMVNEAVKEFPRDFDVSFRDIDPKANAPFNQLRQRFYTATDPYQAYLKSTEMTDPTMHSVWKRQRFRTLPAPITYGVGLQGEAPSSIVFYDTPGQCYTSAHIRTESAMAAGHLAVASAYFFVFDPTLSRSFRSVIPGSGDPQMQLELAGAHIQTQMLSELEIQLRDELNQPPPRKLHVPLAVILNKSDAWLHLLGPEPLLPAVRNGRLHTGSIQANSKRLRRLLFSIAPQVCASAEALSDNVCYFAVSALGKAPVAFTDNTGGGTYIGPETGAVNPVHITDPLLWALHTLEPGILPHVN